MWTSAPPTIALVTLPLSTVAVSAAASMIRSTFSAKSSAAEEELAAAFLKRFLAESPAGAKIDNVGRICVTTCKSRSRKPHSARKKKSRSENWISAINAEARGLSRGHAALIVPFAAVEGRYSAPADFSKSPKLVRAVVALVTLSKNRVARVRVKAAWKNRAG